MPVCCVPYKILAQLSLHTTSSKEYFVGGLEHFLSGLVLLDVCDSSRPCACSRIEIVHCIAEYSLVCLLSTGLQLYVGETGRFACTGDTPVDRGGHPAADDEQDTFHKSTTSHATSKDHLIFLPS